MFYDHAIAKAIKISIEGRQWAIIIVRVDYASLKGMSGTIIHFLCTQITS